MTRLAVTTIALVLLLAGCGGDDEEAASGGGPTKLAVQETAGVPSAFVGFGIEKGIFRKHELEIDLQAAQGGATAIPSLVNGDVHVAGSNVVSLLIAADKGVPIRAIAGGTNAQAQGEDFGALLVSKDGDIKDPADLEGKTIAVNTLQNITEVVVKAALEKDGVDVSTLKMSEVPFPEMAPALEKGDVDAAFSIEPFVTQSVADGAEVLNYSYVETESGMQVGAYAAAVQFAEENADAIGRFQDAIRETAEYVTANEDEFRTFLSERAEMAPKLAERIVLPEWTGEVDAESVQHTSDLMQRYGLVKEAVPADKLVGSGG
jgi:ABC-type nitrate/sulfonate/bicarbonate transport system substrate-binding protein